MKRIVIVGGGFAGIAALKTLAESSKKYEIILIDKKETFDFLPALPDVVGGRINPDFLEFGLNSFCRKIGCKFINQEVGGLDLKKKILSLSSIALSYDYLILSSGSRTNFYADQVIKKYAYALDSVTDARKIIEALVRNSFKDIIVVGGGYTGIELAFNLKRYCRINNKLKKIVLLEKSDSVLSRMSGWIKDHVQANLKEMGIEVITSSGVSQIDTGVVSLSGGAKFKNPLLIWAAGVKVSDYIFNLDKDKTSQGRLIVDQYLRIDDSCFVAGDAAGFFQAEELLRMAVQFSLTQGSLAAKNILNAISGKKLLPYNPRDLGYVIPLSGSKSCGVVLGVKLKGFFATFLHYFMCIFLSRGFKNKKGFFVNLLTKGGLR